MLEIQGKYNTARVYTDNIDSAAYSQILNMMCQCWARDVNVAIMPDVHAGKDCTVGTTMTKQKCEEAGETLMKKFLMKLV
jgi:hypothetical protein